MSAYKDIAEPFWVEDYMGRRVGNYQFIKKELGY